MKVKDVLAMIGDKPLIETLKERGYVCFDEKDLATIDMAAELKSRGYAVFGDEEEEKAMLYVRDDLGYIVFEDVDFNAGLDAYRFGRREEFRTWLRAFFWEALGRIV